MPFPPLKQPARPRSRLLTLMPLLLVLTACGPGTDGNVEYKYFLDFRSEDFYQYDNTYRFTAEKSAAAVRDEPEYFKVSVHRDTLRFFQVEFIRDGEAVAVYAFDERCRVTERRENGKVVAWTYAPDRKTAVTTVNGRVTGRNVFEYRDGKLWRMRVYDGKGLLLRAIPLTDEAAPPAARDRLPAVPDTERRYRMEAEEMLELGK